MLSERDQFTNPPPRRLGALGIIRNPAGAVLMTEKTQDALRGEERRPWFHPGGCVEENEPLLDGLVRSVTAKLGITVQPGRLLAVHHMYHQQHPTHLSVEGVNFLFDCGVIEEGTPFSFGGSITGARWMLPDELDEHLTPSQQRVPMRHCGPCTAVTSRYLPGIPRSASQLSTPACRKSIRARLLP